MTNAYKRRGIAGLALGLCWLPAVSSGAHADPAAEWPTRVTASYKLTFNGFDIGRFNFSSEVNGRGYTLASDADLSLLLGAIKWRGTSRTSGVVSSADVRPAGYAFDYRSNSKQGAVKLGFNGPKVASISIEPQGDRHPDVVPLKDSHLQNVLDPLTAAMMVTRGTGNPCQRKLEIFDGKQRFDLEFSYRRQERVQEPRPTGQPGYVYVCGVRYVPIAGYRKTPETEQMAQGSRIEVALRPVPSANLMVPYKVTIPTWAGTATMSLHRVDIKTSSKGQIALAQ